MFKTALKRAALGIPLGIAIGYIITICISVGIGDGRYFAYVPELGESLGGSELKAVIVQAALCSLLGAASAGSSVIWELDNWSLAKQSVVFFIILSVVMMPIAYIARWMEHSFIGFVSYFAVFAAFFFVIWLVRYLFWKKKISGLNSDITESDK